LRRGRVRGCAGRPNNTDCGQGGAIIKISVCTLSGSSFVCGAPSQSAQLLSLPHQHSTAQHRTAQHSTAQHSTLQNYCSAKLQARTAGALAPPAPSHLHPAAGRLLPTTPEDVGEGGVSVYLSQQELADSSQRHRSQNACERARTQPTTQKACTERDGGRERGKSKERRRHTAKAERVPSRGPQPLRAPSQRLIAAKSLRSAAIAPQKGTVR